MNIHLELAGKLIHDLNTGLKVPRKGDIVYLPYQTVLKGYCTLTVPRNCFLLVYKTLPPIETLPQEEKTEWKKFVNEIFPATTPQFRLEAVKIIYTIGVLTNNYQNKN